MQVLGRFNAAEKKDYLRFTEWDKYKTAAYMATNFNAQRSDGLLQNVSESSRTLGSDIAVLAETCSYRIIFVVLAS